MSTANAQIAFYIGLKAFKRTLLNAELSTGNPGVGGTQYLFLLTVKEYNKVYGTSHALLLTDDEFGLEDVDVPTVIVGNEENAIRYCEKEKINWLVFNANVLDRLPSSVFDTKVKIVAWAHNTLSWKRQKIASKAKSIQRVVCVSKSQYESMKDTPCWEKCVCINNIVPAEFCKQATVSTYADKSAVYIGSVMPQKGVHNLLEIWRLVEKKVPNCQLYIVGGANVWNPKTKLGHTVIADVYYDRVIQRRLGRLLHPENVHFMGAKGWKDINRLISNARVGVVNPSHYMRDETFCMSAIEMEAHGLPVVSRQRNDGLNTSIVHSITGFLEKTDNEIAERLVGLLLDENICKQMGEAAKQYAMKFVPRNEIYKWKTIVDDSQCSIVCKTNGMLISDDARLLQHDFVLKLGFLLESGKWIELLLNKLRRK